jgi:hypothetical protein
MCSPQTPQLVGVEPPMHGRPSSRKPFESAKAESCEAAVARGAWTPTLIVIALGVHAGNGGDAVRLSGAALADGDAGDGCASDGEADVAEGGADEADADEADADEHGCGALTHVPGNNDAGVAGVAGSAAC